jgi:hypothetical protein
VSRPQNLHEVALATIAGTKSFGNAIDEFIDTFYLDHPDKARQQRRLNEPPAIVGDPFIDAWIGAVGGTWQDDGISRCPPGPDALTTIGSPARRSFRTRKPCAARSSPKVRRRSARA